MKSKKTNNASPPRRKKKGVAPVQETTPKTKTEDDPIAAQPTTQAMLRVRGARWQQARRRAKEQHYKYPNWPLKMVEEEIFKGLMQLPIDWRPSDLERVPIKSLTIKNQSLDLRIVPGVHAELTVSARGPNGGLHRLMAELSAEDLRTTAQTLLETADELEALQQKKEATP